MGPQESTWPQIPQITTMTFSNSARNSSENPGAAANEKKSLHPELLDEDIKKPEKFLNKKQEKQWELEDCKRRIIIKITVNDFIPEIENYSRAMSEDYILKNPVTYEARVSGIKMKIYKATGIPPHLLDVLRISISTKRAKLAWVTFGKKKTVSDIFRLAVINGNGTNFNAFPHVPAKAMARRDGIETILKRLQVDNPSLRYQIRLGDNDLDIMLKNHKDYDYVPYRKVTVAMIDPNDKVPEWDLSAKEVEVETNANGKRGAQESPEGKPVSKRQVADWQVSEFIWSYLEGTQTQARYDHRQWEMDPHQLNENEEIGEEAEPEETGEEAEPEENQEDAENRE